MIILDVPEVVKLPEGSTGAGNVSQFADLMLTSLLSCAPSILHAEHEPGKPAVTWFVRELLRGVEQPAVSVGSTDFAPGYFRAVLARFGHHYMGDQLYGGHTTCVLRQRGREHRCRIYMSNNGQSGFWIRIYATVISPGGENAMPHSNLLP
jgi:hypothetical protein